MGFVAKAVSSLADNWFGMDRPNAVAAPPPPNTSIAGAELDQSKNQSIKASGTNGRRGDGGATLAGGQSGLALDPLGRQGAGYVPARKSMLGR